MKKKYLKTRHALLMSCISLMTCFAMLVGATFAWFTDSVTSGVNRIVAGNLDVEVYHVNSETAPGALEDSKKVDNQTQLFRASIEGNKKLWEPGAMAYETFTVKNVGSLALKYQMAFNKVGNNFVMEKDSNGVYQNTGRSLLDVLRVGVIDGALAGGANRSTVAGQVTAWTTLKDFGNVFTADQNLAPGVDGEPFTVVLYWPSDTENVSALAGGTLKDNDYNLQNGKYASDASAATVGELYIDLGITLLATQDTVEADSFDNQYDASSTQPSDGWSGVYQVSQTVSGSNTTNEAKTITIGNNGASATIPSAVAQSVTTDNETNTTTTTTTTYELTVEPTTAPSNFSLDSTGNSAVHYEIDLSQYTTTTTQVGDATPESTDSEKTGYSGNEVIKVELKIGQVDLQSFYHNGTAMTLVTSTSASNYGADQTYMYDSASGVLTLWTSSFSPFSATYKYAGGLGTERYPYVIDGVKMWKALVDATASDSSYTATAGKYFSVTSDIDVSSYSERMNIHYFAGHIDFNNHSFTGLTSVNSPASDVGDDGITGLFSVPSGNVTISNLKFTTTRIVNDGNVVAAQITGANYYAGNLNITFNNVDTYGSVTGTNINNNGLLLSYVCGAEANITMTDCDNHANLIGNGYKSAFLGNMGYGAVRSITATNCHNYGTIVSKDAEAAMFVSNAGYLSTNRIVTIKNCSNEGHILQKMNNGRNNLFTTKGDSQYLYVVNGKDLSKMTDEDFNNATKDELKGELVKTITSTDLTTNDGKFVLSATENAERYEVTFSFAAGGNAAGGGAGYTLQLTPSDLKTAAIFVYDWINLTAAKNEIVPHNEYGTTYYTSGNHYVFNREGATIRGKVLATFTAFDGSDNILTMATYQYE